MSDTIRTVFSVTQGNYPISRSLKRLGVAIRLVRLRRRSFLLVCILDVVRHHVVTRDARVIKDVKVFLSHSLTEISHLLKRRKERHWQATRQHHSNLLHQAISSKSFFTAHVEHIGPDLDGFRFLYAPQPQWHRCSGWPAARTFFSSPSMCSRTSGNQYPTSSSSCCLANAPHRHSPDMWIRSLTMFRGTSCCLR